jgi:hypothetical protein
MGKGGVAHRSRTCTTIAHQRCTTVYAGGELSLFTRLLRTVFLVNRASGKRASRKLGFSNLTGRCYRMSPGTLWASSRISLRISSRAL